MKSITFIAIFVFFFAATYAATDKVFCYYGSWAHYRSGEAKLTVDDLKEAKHCTHIIYTFLLLNNDGTLKIADPWLEIDLKALEKLSQLKNTNPNLKVMVAVGGWGEGSARFSSISADKNLRQKLVDDVVNFMKKYDLNGFDLDWEYPAAREGSHPQDKQNFIELIKELKEKFKPNGWILTAAVGATKQHRDVSYDVKSMSQYLDYINVMAYDLHDYSGGKTAFNAPLYAAPSEEGRELNVYDIINGWIKDGAQPEKLVMGLGFYGKSFTLQNSNNVGVGAPTKGAGTAGQFTQEAGVLSYLEICKKIKFEGWQYDFDDKQKVPFAHDKQSQWVGFDDARSIKLKVDVAKKLKLGGVMMWSIEQDDTKNTCGDGAYPLLNAIGQQLGKNEKQSDVELNDETSSIPVKKKSLKPKYRSKKPVYKKKETTTTTTTTSTPNYENDGLHADRNDCHFYYMKYAGNSYRMPCPAGTLFDKSILMCNHEFLVKC